MTTNATFRRLVVVFAVLNGLVAMIALFMGGSSAMTARGPAPATTAPDQVDRQLAAWQLTDAEARWREGGWLGNMDEAFRLARQLDRPVIVLALIGDLGKGRC